MEHSNIIDSIQAWPPIPEDDQEFIITEILENNIRIETISKKTVTVF